MSAGSDHHLGRRDSDGSVPHVQPGDRSRSSGGDASAAAEQGGPARLSTRRRYRSTSRRCWCSQRCRGPQDACGGRQEHRLLRDSGRQFTINRCCPPASRRRPCGGMGRRVAQDGGPLVFNAPSLTIEANWSAPGGSLGQRARGCDGRLPAAPAARSTRRCTGRTRPAASQDDDARPRSASRPSRTPGRCRSSRTCTAPSGRATRATATPRPGTCRRRATSRRATPPTGTWYGFFRGASGRRRLSRRAVGRRAGDRVPLPERPARPSTLWYHDHTLGMTRLNVYAGPAGFYLLRGGPGDAVVDAARHAGHPARARARRLAMPPGRRYYEIPIAIQDRSFNADGSLFYPGHPRLLRWASPGPYIPRRRDISPIWNPEFFGNTMVVNGKAWPCLVRGAAPVPVPVPQRLRLAVPDPRLRRSEPIPRRSTVWQIGAEGGFLRGAGELTLTATAADGPGRARRCHRGLHATSPAAPITPAQPRARTSPSAAACPARSFDHGRPGHDRPGDAVRCDSRYLAATIRRTPPATPGGSSVLRCRTGGSTRRAGAGRGGRRRSFDGVRT